MKLMVYGTLQRNHGNNRLLQNAEFLGVAVTKKKYVLLNCGFPFAIPHTPDEDVYPLLPITGEVFEVKEDDVSRCDRLEGHPSWYRREKIKVVLQDQEEEVYIYEMPTWQSNLPLCSITPNGYYCWAR